MPTVGFEPTILAGERPQTHVPLGTTNINEYFQATGLPECFVGWQVQTKPANQQTTTL